MNDAEWSQAMDGLSEAANFTLVLSRCLDVRPHLTGWRQTSEDLPGAIAADGLDQAKGMLERLIGGHAETLLRQVEVMLADLPPALD